MPLRMPRIAAAEIADAPAAVPPVASTPTRANCEPPVNMTRLITEVCQTSSPAATARAP